MAAKFRKIKIITVLTIMMTFSSVKCYAFPVWHEDFMRIAENVFVMLQQVQEIKNEIESNLSLIKEIQQGGYAAAANDLFANLKGDVYDRFGKNLDTLESRIKSSAEESINLARDKTQEATDRNEEMVTELIEETIEENQGETAVEEGKAKADAAAEAEKQKKKSIFQNLYERSQSNRTAGNN